jgi:hypothetical protein
MPGPFSTPTAYGSHLRTVLEHALAWAPHLFTPAEHALAARLPAGTAGDALARLAQRVDPACPRAELAIDEPALASAVAAGWLELRTRGRDDGQALIASVAASAAPVALTAPALALVAAALAVASAGEQSDLSLPVRLALGSASAPPGSPLAAVAAGAPPRRGSAPWADRAGLDAWLEARHALDTQPDANLAARALTEVEAAVGTPLPLFAHHLLAPARWARVLWHCRGLWPVDDPRQARALRALLRAPASPGLARELWTEVHRRHRATRLGEALAARFARWPLWSAGERERWRRRAERSPVRRGQDCWPRRTLPAWLARGGASVLADGMRVEAWACDRLGDDGWSACHAEGGFWLALAAQVYAPALAAEVPGAWAAPLQAWPLDWGHAGFRRRRAGQVAAISRALARDPAGMVAAVAPDDAAARAVARLLPAPALVELLETVLDDHRAAAGLPDVVAWRGGELALWEVKSPGDRLSDDQRHWLRWLNARGVAAGELRIEARASEQASLFPSPPASAPAPAAPPRPRTAAAPRLALALDVGDGSWQLHAVEPGAPVPGLPNTVWSRSLLLPVGRWGGGTGETQVEGWARPVDAVAALPAAALLVELGRGRHLRRRLFPLPAGWTLPALVADEVRNGGGIGPAACLVVRPAGWFLPAAWWPEEPVIAPLAEVRACARTPARWQRHPAADPPLAEVAAAAWGLQDELDTVLAAIDDAPCAIHRCDATRSLAVAVPAGLGLLWPADEARVRRWDLPRIMG